MVPTLSNQRPNPVVPTLPVVEMNVPLLEVAATIAAALGCNSVNMGCPAVAWANQEATSTVEVFDEAAA